MDKTFKYILIGIAVFLIGMLFVMYSGNSDRMNEEMNNTSSQISTSTPKSQVSTIGYKDITTKELASMLKNKDFTLVNVHVPYIGDIKGTDLSIPFNTIAKNLNKLPADKTAKIVLYCQSGNMGDIAADTLTQLGYSNIYNVKGGMIQWQKDGNTLIKK